MTAYLAELAWLGTAAEPDANVLIEVAGDRFRAVTPGVVAPPAGTTRLPGLTVPGLANTHSHAFHRALRGRTHSGKGTFWTWRTAMYAVANRVDPETYLALAHATYAEMALAGVTCVGEFHYLHHAPGGYRYRDPNEMSEALVAAARHAGIRITLLDTCYLTSTVDGRGLGGAQLRFGDVDAAGWAARAGAFAPDDAHAKTGAAIHSVRAVPVSQLSTVVEYAADRYLPLHVHLSEQRAENDACHAYHRKTPTELLADAGVLGPRTTAVHATHLTDTDRAQLGDSDTSVCFCPTTERDLADGIGPARALVDAGCPVSLGTDSHAQIDLFEEARALELNERLRSQRRGHFSAAELLRAATATGHAALGWPDAGTIAPGGYADLVTVRLDTVRTAGAAAADAVAAVVFGATASDVRQVVSGGQLIVADGVHCGTPDVAGALRAAIEALC